MAKSANKITLFSNGIGHFQRFYSVSPKSDLSFGIPFKRDHIGDVASSLQVMGRVRLTKPPSFTPSNANATALKIVQGEAYKSLVRNLSGARVSVTFFNGDEGECTLLGLDTEEKIVGDCAKKVDLAIFMKDGAVRRCFLSDISNLYFVDESVRTEIDKALKNNFQTIKPDSTLLELSLTSLEDTEQEAAVQYTIPVSSWKMRYSLRHEKGAYSIEGSAVVDNNTDEDWDNFTVSVVTGNPVSFATDIATVCVPIRKFINVVESQSLGYEAKGLSWLNEVAGGAMAVPPKTTGPGAGFGYPPISGSIASGSIASFSLVNNSTFGMEQAKSVEEILSQSAESDGVDSAEVGDFCVFTSKQPITILARKSAIVPMFNIPLTTAGFVLHYKETHNARRPYRAVKFKNETGHSLGRGKVLVYNEGVFSGECILDTAKKNENRILPYCIETGVRFVKEGKPVETRRHAIRISDGIGLTEDANKVVTTYTIDNWKDEPFKVVFDHIHTLRGQTSHKYKFSGVEIKEEEKLGCGDGVRVYFELKPKETVTLTVTEHSLVSRATSMAGNYYWLNSNVVSVKNPLTEDSGILHCVGLQQDIDDKNRTISDLELKRKELTERGGRIRQNVQSTGSLASSQIINGWVNDLDLIEKEIHKIETEDLPDYRNQVTELVNELNEELKKLSVNWTEES